MGDAISAAGVFPQTLHIEPRPPVEAEERFWWVSDLRFTLGWFVHRFVSFVFVEYNSPCDSRGLSSMFTSRTKNIHNS